MELLKIEFPMSKLSSIQENEQVFFVQIGSILNDLSMLQKLTVFSTNIETSNQVVRAAQNFQTLSLLRIQAGKLHEGWSILQKNFSNKEFSKKYLEKLTPTEKLSYDRAMGYFDDKKNLITWVRNNFAFHYFTKPKAIIKLLDKVPSSEIFEMYMSEIYGNCIFSMSDTLINFAILKYTSITDINEAMAKLLNNIKEITECFGHFLGRFLLVFAEEYLGLQSKKVEIPEPPNIDKVTLPYFIKS